MPRVGFHKAAIAQVGYIRDIIPPEEECDCDVIALVCVAGVSQLR